MSGQNDVDRIGRYECDRCGCDMFHVVVEGGKTVSMRCTLCERTFLSD